MFATISNRLNTFLLVLLVLMAASIIAILASRASGGPLDPPAPPSATGPNQIFQPSSCAGFPITAAGGAWVLAQDIIMPAGCGKNGIEIGADTTLDLRGFRLVGGAGSLSGIHVTGTPSNIEIRNGIVLYWGHAGVDLWIDSGTFAANSRIDNLRVYGNFHGILIAATTSVTNSTIATSGGVGILTLISGNVIANNTVNGSHCAGINVQGTSNTVVNNILYGNSGGCGTEAIYLGGSQNRVDSNTIDANGAAHAVNVVAGTGNTIVRNIATNASGAYFLVPPGNNYETAYKGNPLNALPWANIYY